MTDQDIDPKRWKKLAGILKESTQLNEEPVQLEL
jgi:hypothetical protein